MEQTNYIEEVKKIQTALNELRNRNLLLKEQLSEALSQDVNTDFVEKAEWFQQCFLATDQVIDLLRHEINTLLKDLSDGGRKPDSENQCTKLKTDVKKLGRSMGENERMFRTFLARDPAN